MNAVRGFAEVLRFGRRYIYERLRVAVNQREPGALHLNHDAMAAAERVKDVGNREFDFSDFAGLEWLWLLEAVAEFATKNVAANELLVTAHGNMSGVWIRVGEVACVNINELDDPISVRAARRNVQSRF